MVSANHASSLKTSYPEPPSASDVQSQLDRLSDAIEQLQRDAADLVVRLGPVLKTDNKPEAGHCSAIEAGAETSIGERIYTAARMVRGVSLSVRDAIARLGV